MPIYIKNIDLDTFKLRNYKHLLQNINIDG